MTRCNSVRKNMLLASLALALFAVGSAGYEYRDVYETLYSKAGYHAGTADTHGIPNVHTVQRKYMRQVESVLDVGCSHGDVVAHFWRLGKLSSGMDVSPTAVRRAAQTRCKPDGECNATRCVEECFRAGSVLAIPWADESFDAVVSSDVMEHIAEDDVPAAVREIHRVSRKLVLLLIAPRAEINKRPVQQLQRLARTAAAEHASLAKVSTLHLTVKNLSWWANAFVTHGPFELISSVTGANHQIELRKRRSPPAGGGLSGALSGLSEAWAARRGARAGGTSGDRPRRAS